ncbi:MAG: S49 family peptidase [Alphaproteobacteria bacterium]
MTAPWQGDEAPAPRPAPPPRRGGFWRGFGNVVLYGLALFGLTVLVGVVVGIVALSRLGEAPALPEPPYVVTVDLDNGVVERSTPALGPFEADGEGLAVRPLIEALERAASDPRVAAVAVNAGNAGMSPATAEDVRGALRAVSAAGKPVYAFAPGFGTLQPGTVDYYAVVGASELWMAPSGQLSLTGLAIEAPFIGDALQRLQVEPRFGAREDYKSAIETFTRAGFSGPAREALQAQVDSMAETIADAIADGRGLQSPAVARLIGAVPFGAEAARDAALIDRLGYIDEFVDAVEERHPGATLVDVVAYGAALEPPDEPAATVAYIQALGPVVDLAGDAFDTSVVAPDNVGAALVSALNDPTVDAVVLRIDSPGGTVTGADAIWRDVVRLREAGKPVVASMGSVAASGGYYIAMAADRIVAQPGTLTGSIGVFAGKFVIGAATAGLGITWDRVAHGENAGMFGWSEDYTPAQWQALNAMLDRIYDDFVHKAAAGRRMGFDDLEAVAGGRVWSGADAHDRGLVDVLGGPSQALAEVRDLLRLPPDAPLAVRVLPEPRTPLEELLGFLQAPSADVSVQIALPPALAPWPEIIDLMRTPDALLRLPPMRIDG